MQPLQRLYDSENNEVCLFPMEYLYLSPDRVPAEHQLLAMDFLGWNSLGRVYDCPCYAPVSCQVVYTGRDHNMICWSLSPVRCADGTLSDISILVAHSDTAPGSVGTTYVQGQLWYHSGNYGQSTGDHLHMEVAKGHVMWDGTGTHLESPSHLYDIMCVNDTVLARPESFDWKTYDGPSPEDKKKHHFPWAIYGLKFYERRKKYGNTF